MSHLRMVGWLYALWDLLKETCSFAVYLCTPWRWHHEPYIPYTYPDEASAFVILYERYREALLQTGSLVRPTTPEVPPRNGVFIPMDREQELVTWMAYFASILETPVNAGGRLWREAVRSFITCGHGYDAIQDDSSVLVDRIHWRIHVLTACSHAIDPHTDLWEAVTSEIDRLEHKLPPYTDSALPFFDNQPVFTTEELSIEDRWDIEL